MRATTVENHLPRRLAAAFAAALATLCLLFVAALPSVAEAGQKAPASSTGKRATHTHATHRHRGKAHRRQLRRRQARRHRLRARRARARRANRRLAVASNAAVSQSKPKPKAAPSSTDSDILDAGFEEGLFNWNTAGVGEAIPSVVDDTARSGLHSGRFVLSGDQDRSELILGGNGGGSTRGMIEFGEGAEYWYGFSFQIDQMVYGRPGAHNLIMQFKGNDDGSPAFGLQLWDYEGDDGEYAGEPKGLWSHGPAMDGDRFLAPVSEHEWHDIAIHFKASAVGAGFYEVFLDGDLVDARGGVSMIADGASFAYIKDGLYRNGGEIPGTSEIHLDAARLGHSQADVVTG
jgi:Polysaccharide lyase